jgi:hypothetical protein
MGTVKFTFPFWYQHHNSFAEKIFPVRSCTLNSLNVLFFYLFQIQYSKNVLYIYIVSIADAGVQARMRTRTRGLGE